MIKNDICNGVWLRSVSNEYKAELTLYVNNLKSYLDTILEDDNYIYLGLNNIPFYKVYKDECCNSYKMVEDGKDFTSEI